MAILVEPKKPNLTSIALGGVHSSINLAIATMEMDHKVLPSHQAQLILDLREALKISEKVYSAYKELYG